MAGVYATTASQVPVSANVLDLLPQIERNPLVAQSLRTLADESEHRLLLLLSVDDPAELAECSAGFDGYLRETGEFSDGDASLFDLTDLSGYRYQLLREEQLAELLRDPDRAIDQALARLYGALGVFQAEQLMTDPLNLYVGYMASLVPDVRLINGRTPVFSSAGRTWALHSPQLKVSGFDVADPERLQRLLQQMRTWASERGALLRMTGVPVFAAHGASSAYREVSLFGTVSVVSVTVLLLSVFRSGRPLGLMLLSVACGIGAAFVVTAGVFDQVHVLTLVFGTSLIGISIDYGLHYLCRRFDPAWSPEGGLTKVLPGITLALVTSTGAFASMVVTPFPGLQQVAVFSATGLVAAWFTVVALFPFAARAAPAARRPWLMRLTSAYQARWPFLSPRLARLALAIAGVATLWGVLAVDANDDVRLLQSAPEEMYEEDRFVRSVLPGDWGLQFLLVQAADADAVLERERSLRSVLETQIEEGNIRGYRALSDYYPDRRAQQHNYRALHAAFYDSGRIADMYRKIGIAPDAIAAHVNEIARMADRVVPLDVWLRGVPAYWRSLWLGCESGECASMVRVEGLRDPAALQAATGSFTGVEMVDQVSDFSALLGRYREVATWLLGGVYGLIALLLLWRMGGRASVGILFVPFAACAWALASVHFAGSNFSLFNLFALLLVVGISIDYAIFFHLADTDDETTVLAIALSAATTTMAFGLLSLSSTAVVQAFGQTLVAGIVAAFLLGPLASARLRARILRGGGC